jgi:hypothetical protein
MPETAIRQARRHVREGEKHVAKQTTLVAKLEQQGHLHEADQARQTLAVLEESLQLHREHLERELNGNKGSPPVMGMVEEYRRRAAEAERLAERAASDEQRKHILEIAETWRSMADQQPHIIKSGRPRP